MKKLLILVCMLAAGTSSLSAQKAGDLGAGIILGSPTGVTGKFWLDDRQALDFGVGFNDHLSLYGDYLWHSWNVLPQPSRGKLPLYLGLGAQVGDSPNHNLGVRAVAGAAYWLPNDPLEVFFEIVPVLYFSDGLHADLNAAIGLRYYFKW